MDWKRRRTLPTGLVRRVAITGGTHGNEANGVQLAKHLLRNPETANRKSFQTEVVLTNVESIKRNLRYVEEDMNRCFLLKDLKNDSLTSLEARRAKEVDKILGPKSSDEPRCDLVIDLHNTTASTGICLLCAPNDDFAHEIAYHLMSLDSEVRVVNWSDVEDWALCPSIGRSGMTFEVGPCPWGCVIGELYSRSLKLIHAALDYVHGHNLAVEAQAAGRSTVEFAEVSVPCFRALTPALHIDYPRNAEGELLGMIHPELEGGDFKELKDGSPIFMEFDGTVVPFRQSNYKIAEDIDSVHALFVNEAAYYEKNIAFMLVRKLERKIRILRAKA